MSSGFDNIFRGGSPDGEIDPEFLREVETELSRRLGRRVELKPLTGTALAVAYESELGLGRIVLTMAHDWVLHKSQPSEWADILERKIKGEDTFGKLAGRAEDVEEILEAIQASPSTAETGRIVLDGIEEYDNEFFAALDDVIALYKANLVPDRVLKLERLRDYLRYIRRRSDAGELENMRKELSILVFGGKQGTGWAVVVDPDEILKDKSISEIKDHLALLFGLQQTLSEPKQRQPKRRRFRSPLRRPKAT